MRLTPLLILLCFCSMNVKAIEKESNNHIYLGLNTYVRDYSEDLIAPSKSDEFGLLLGFLFEFEHKAPKHIMFSAGIGIDGGVTEYDGALQDKYGNYIQPHKDNTENVFINFETLLGYTLQPLINYTITPFVGVGHKAWGRGLGNFVEMYQWDHVCAGLQFDYKRSESLNYGLRLKVMPMLKGTMEIDSWNLNEIVLGNKTHFELSLPIEYTCKTNAWRFTPYYTYQAFGESNFVPSHYAGVVVQEPASRTHIIGLKAEYVWPL